MAVGHPDYWRRMVTRISVEGFAPEFYEGYDARQIDAGENETVISYAIPVGYLFNMTGFIVSCDKPGHNYINLGKLGGNAIIMYWDTVLMYQIPQGLFTTLAYGDTFRVVISNEMDYNALFWVSIQGVLEFEG